MRFRAGARRRRPAIAALLPLACVGWLGVRAHQVASHLGHAKATLAGLGNLSGALRAGPAFAAGIRSAVEDAHAARGAVDDPIWRVAAAVPVAGRSLAMVRELAGITSDLLDHAGPSAVQATQLIAGRRLIAQGQVDLSLLDLVRPPVESAVASAAAARRRIASVSTRFVPHGLADQRDALRAQVDRLADGLSTASEVLQLAPEMLGRDGPRRYFVAVMNQAESRAAGGFIGAYAILRTDAGRISQERIGTDDAFHGASNPVVDLGPEFSRNYDQYYARTAWSALGVSPHWPYTAQVTAGLCAAQGWGRLDGVLGLDPLSMADLLGATGPVAVGGHSLSAANVAAFVFRDEYTEFTSATRNTRQRLLTELAGGLFKRLVAGSAPTTALVRALGHAGGSGHLRLYSTHPEEQSRLSGLPIAAELPDAPGAYLSVITQNIAGNKIDSYLRRRVDYTRPQRGQGRLVLTLRNLVPPHAPRAMLQRLDDPITPPAYGETKLLVTVYASVGATVIDASVDGAPAPFVPGTERGHGTATLLVPVRPGHPTVLAMDVVDAGGALRFDEQALAVPDDIALHVPTRAR